MIDGFHTDMAWATMPNVRGCLHLRRTTTGKHFGLGRVVSGSYGELPVTGKEIINECSLPACPFLFINNLSKFHTKQTLSSSNMRQSVSYQQLYGRHHNQQQIEMNSMTYRWFN
jgi:hypothetical protein